MKYNIRNRSMPRQISAFIKFMLSILVNFMPSLAVSEIIIIWNEATLHYNVWSSSRLLPYFKTTVARWRHMHCDGYFNTENYADQLNFLCWLQNRSCFQHFDWIQFMRWTVTNWLPQPTKKKKFIDARY